MAKSRPRKDGEAAFSEEAFSGFGFEEKWKEALAALYDIAKIFTAQPRSKATKKILRKMFDAIWDIIPEHVQLVARRSLPESALYGEYLSATPRWRKKDDALDHVEPTKKELKEEDDGKS